MKKSNALLTLFLILVAFLAGLKDLQAVESSREELEDSVQREVQVQKEVDKWSQEKQELVNQILNLKTELQWLKYQNKKYSSYNNQLMASIDKLEHQQEELGRLRLKLEPYLDGTVQRLEEAVSKDKPFLPRERRERLDFIQSSLMDYEVDLYEKLRRVLEALQVEAGYGNTVEVKQRNLNLEKGEKLMQVLRVGRIGLYYLSLDNSEAGWWNPQAQSWEKLPHKFVQPIKRTIDIAEKKRAADLVDLPLEGQKNKP